MKYLTKEFYNAMQKMSLHFPLRASKKAEVFSEDYFKKLYKKEMPKFLAFLFYFTQPK